MISAALSGQTTPRKKVIDAIRRMTEDGVPEEQINRIVAKYKAENGIQDGAAVRDARSYANPNEVHHPVPTFHRPSLGEQISEGFKGSNPSAMMGPYTPPQGTPNPKAAMDRIKWSNDLQAKTSSAIEDNPVSTFLAGLDPTDVLIPSWKKGLVGHILGAVGGVANIPVNVAGNLQMVYDPQSAPEQKLKALASIGFDLAGGVAADVALKGAAKGVLKGLSKTVVGRPVAVGAAIKQTERSGVRAISELVKAGVPKELAVRAVETHGKLKDFHPQELPGYDGGQVPDIKKGLKPASDIGISPEHASETPVSSAQPKEAWQMTAGELESHPDTVFHGTTKEFSGFKTPDLAREQANFFTPNKEYAKTYSGQAGSAGDSRVIAARVHLKNPLRVSYEDFKAHVNGTGRIPFMDEARAQGHDGMILDKGKGNIEIISFDEGQIKTHRQLVEQALKEGKPVPAHVLAEYPDLTPSIHPVQDVPVVKESLTTQPKARTVAQGETFGTSNQAFAKSEHIEAPKGKGQSAQALVDEAAKSIDHESALRLSEDIASGKAPYNPENAAKTQAGVAKLHAKVNEYAQLMDEAKDGADYLHHQQLYEEARANLQKFSENVQKGKSGWSDVGRILSTEVDEMGNFAGMQESYRRALPKGVEVTDTQSKNIKAFADEFTRQAQQIDRLQNAAAHERVSRASRWPRFSKESLDAELESILADFKNATSALKGQTNDAVQVLATYGVEGTRAIGRLAIHAAKRGINELDKVVEFVQGHVPGISRQEVIDAIALPGEPRTKSELAQKLAQLRNEAAKLSTEGQSKAARVAEAKAKSKAQGEARRSLMEADRLERSGRAAEAKKLRDDIKARAAEGARLDKEALRLDAQAAKEQNRVFDRETELRGQIAEYERRMREGDFEAKPKDPGVTSKEIEKLKEQQKTTRAKFEAMRRAAMPRSAVAKVDSYVSGSVLSDPISRVIDLTANTVKLVGHVVTSPIRQGVSHAVDVLAGTKGSGVMGSVWNPKKYARALEGSGTRIGEEVKRAWAGGNMDSLAKYGTGNIVTRITGMSDIPFKEFYTRMALDDMAWAEARRQTKDRTAQAAIAKKLLAEPTNEMALAAEDYALRQTFNSQNFFSSFVEGAKQKAAQGVKDQWGENGADAVKLAINTVFRYSKVIGNVAMERVNYHPVAAGAEVAARLGKRALTKTPLSAAESRLVSEIATKGLTGVALSTAGAMLYKNGYLQPEIKKTKNGKIYADWGWLDQVGGAVAPLLYGATMEAADHLKLTDKQKEQFVWDTSSGLMFNQPFISTPKRVLEATRNGDSFGKLLGSIAATSTVPGAVKRVAVIGDPDKNSPTPFWWLEDGRDVDSKEFWTEYMKRLPALRNTLPTKETETLVKRKGY